jgi:RNA polymerase sigma-70 factor (family 1)
LSLGLETSEIFNGHETISRAHVLAWAPLFVSKGSPRASKPVSGVPRLFFDTTFLPLHCKDSIVFYEFLNFPCLLHKVEHSAEDYFLLFQKGEERGFDYFYHQYFRPLFHYALSILNEQRLAEDILEDCFVKLWEKRITIESAAGIKPYLYTAVRNTCINLLNREKHKSRYISHVKTTEQQFETDVTQRIIISESMQQVYNAIETLPPKHRKLIKMIYLEEKKLKEVASELNLSLSTVKNQKAKAIELLKEQLPNLGFLLALFFFK